MIITEYVVLLLMTIFSFFVGGIPTGYLLAKWYGVSDIRAHGSGNIGASNIGRVIGWWAFLIVFIIDAAKAALVIYAAQKIGIANEWLLCVAFAIVLGNCFSPFLHFNGGKGVATLMGIVGVFCPFILCCAVVVWLIILIITRTPAIASVTTLFTLSFLSYFFLSFSFIFFFFLSSFIILWRHKKNFQIFENMRFRL